MTDTREHARPLAGRNRLQYESSPYLLQHADNPVDWFPWCEEAFRKAVQEDKPVFLSIGYSSCHWCHVMEAESFQDPQVAALLNASFVSVKVDREERPDVDQAYMAMAQAATGQGGWPLTAIASPDGRPFFLGMYLPKQSRHGRIGLMDLLSRVSRNWADTAARAELLSSAGAIVSATQRALTPEPGDRFPGDADWRAFGEMAGSFDPAHGGFGAAPKFPVPERLRFLLRYWWDSGVEEALSMATRTLDEMRAGGIYDHLGSGFHRYSVDSRWAVPHFEKMLYDQALLAEAYLDAYLITGESRYALTVRDVLGYVRRRLGFPEGAFYCAEDADTGEGEGAYYIWTVRQLREVLDAELLRVVLATMGIQPPGEPSSFGTSVPEDAPLVPAFINGEEEVAHALGVTSRQVEDGLRRARGQLLAARDTREPVKVDDKVTADWNGLAIAAFARAGRALDDAALMGAAEVAAEFVVARMMRDGVLMHTYKDGVASVPGFLEDYASMALGLLELYQATHRARHLRLALHLVDQTLALFQDEESGGFHQAGRHGEELVVQMKPVFDGAVPSGNSMAAMALAIAARVTGRVDIEEAADRLFRWLGPSVLQSPSQFASLIRSHRLHAGEMRVTTVVAGDDGAATRALLQTANAVYAPDQFLVLMPRGAERTEVEAIAPVSSEYVGPHGASVAYVCTRTACSPPVTDVVELRRLLESTVIRGQQGHRTDGR